MAFSRSCLCGALGGIKRWPHSLSEVMNTPTAPCSSFVRSSLWWCNISYRYRVSFGPCCVKERWRTEQFGFHSEKKNPQAPKSRAGLTSRPGLRLSFKMSTCLESNTNSSASLLSERGSAGLSVCTRRRPIWTLKVSRQDQRILCH